jgi:mannitol-specific phosphotransferase system IIBC component
MKKLLVIVLLAFAPAFAADPVVIVTNFSSVTVDGAPAGSVVDVLANVTKSNIRARLLDALLAYETKLIEDATAAQTARADAAIAANDKEKQDAIAAKTAAEQSQAAAVAARNEAETRAAAIVAAVKAAQFVGAPPAALASAILTTKEKERAALLAAKADAEAKLAALP